MKFVFDGIEFDTREMLCPQITDRTFARLYITRDFRYVFGVSFTKSRDLEISPLEDVALHALAVRTGCREVILALETRKAAQTSLEYSRDRRA